MYTFTPVTAKARPRRLLNDLIAETEEKGFAAGAKYTAELGMELFAE